MEAGDSSGRRLDPIGHSKKILPRRNLPDLQKRENLTYIDI